MTTLSAPPANPLTAASGLPYNLPRFADVRLDHFKPAIKEVMARGVRDVEEIVRKPASYENTILGLERAGQDPGRARSVLSHLVAVTGTDGLRALNAELAPVLAEHGTRLMQTPGLWERVKEVHDNRADLPPVGQRLVEKYYDMLFDSGAALSPGDKEKFTAISTRLSSEATTFRDKMTNGAKAHTVFFTQTDEIAGLPEDSVERLAAAARSLGREQGYAVSLGPATVVDFLSYCTNRESRYKVWDAFTTYTNRGDEFDTNENLQAIHSLRQQQAQLLGFANFAEWSTARKMAGTPAAALGLLTSLVEPARKAFLQERADIQAFAGTLSDHPLNEPLKPWDGAYYARRHEEAVVGITDKELKPYLELGSVRAAFFQVCQRLFGLTFVPRPELVGAHPEAQLWEAFVESGGAAKGIGLLMTDDHERPGEKRAGAWMDDFTPQNGLSGDRPLIMNVMNYPRPVGGKPVCLTLDNATTLFHEGGHGLHGLFSKTPVPSLSGTNVEWDAVELPSQLMETFLTHPQLMAEHLRHHETGAPMPPEMIARVQKKLRHDQGQFVLRQLALGICDLEVYQRTEAFDPQTFERQTLDRHGIPAAAAPRPMFQKFAHIFAGGYAGGYYSYMWANVLVADAAEAFKPDPLNPELGRKLHDEILSTGGTRPMAENYRGFRGGNADPLALKRSYGWG